MTAARAKFDILQVSLLSEGSTSLPKDAIEALASEIVPSLPLYVYIFETDDIIKLRFNVSTRRFEKTKPVHFAANNYRALSMTNGDMLLVYSDATYIKMNRATHRQTKEKKIDIGESNDEFFNIWSLTRVSDDSDTFMCFSDIFMQRYCEIDFATGRVLKFGTSFPPDPVAASRFGGRYGTIFKVGRGRALFKKEGSIDPDVPTRLGLLDVRTKKYIELPSPFEEGHTNHNHDVYIGMHDGNIMMIGGWLENDPEEITLVTRKLDIGTMTWSNIATIPKNGLYPFVMPLPTNHILVIFQDDEDKLAAYVYDPHADKWETISVDYTFEGTLTKTVIAN